MMLLSDVPSEGGLTPPLSPDAEVGVSGETEAEQPPLVVDVVTIGSDDSETVANALTALEATVRRFPQAEAWLTGLTSTQEEPSAELIVLVGSATQIVANDWVFRAKQRCGNAVILAAVTAADVRSAARLLRQGARAFVEITPRVEQLADDMGWLVHDLAATRGATRAADQHRRNMANLTQAELDVLRRMLAGKTNKQVALELRIGLRTVELRRSKIMKKMGSDTVAQLLWFVHQSGAELHS